MHGGRGEEEGNGGERRKNLDLILRPVRDTSAGGTGNDFRQHKVLNNAALNNKIVSFSIFSQSLKHEERNLGLVLP